MARTFSPPVKRVDRLLARADRLAAWARAQAYLEGRDRPTVKRAPRSKRSSR
jgi:hypothetical protein